MYEISHAMWQIPTIIPMKSAQAHLVEAATKVGSGEENRRDFGFFWSEFSGQNFIDVTHLAILYLIL